MDKRKNWVDGQRFDIIFPCKTTYECGWKTQTDEENSLSIFHENCNGRTEALDGYVTDKASQR
jgi:hypothetical protein